VNHVLLVRPDQQSGQIASALCGSENARDNLSRVSLTFFAAAVIVRT
jgi:hypothetical protein